MQLKTNSIIETIMLMYYSCPAMIMIGLSDSLTQWERQDPGIDTKLVCRVDQTPQGSR